MKVTKQIMETHILSVFSWAHTQTFVLGKNEINIKWEDNSKIYILQETYAFLKHGGFSGFAGLKLKIGKFICWLIYSMITDASASSAFLSSHLSAREHFGDDTAKSMTRVLHQRSNSQKQQKV
ncbi:unnamed protein product [Thlaspi arvense]|uniref:Uncharacterized protein n=1 Tax=Thlaspi arvense TaxID=13288 RepID=A0AAU9T466_THLAR|nr:unnamed protein product [Thlaspi arvense]